jgi:hypothetical protein
MGEQQKESDVSGVASDDGISAGANQPVELKAAAGIEAEKPKRRSTTNAKIVSNVAVEPAKPKKTRSAKARNVIVNAASSGDIQVEAGQEQSDGSRPDSRNSPSLPPAPVPTPEGIAFMQQHVAYQSALEERTKHDRARLEEAAQGSKGPSPRNAQQTCDAGKQPGILDDKGTGVRDDATAAGPGTVQPTNVRSRKARENSIEAGRVIRKAAIGGAGLQAVKDHDDARLLRQMLGHSRVLAAPAESTATVSSAADAARSDVVALRAIKDPATRKLGMGATEQNWQADAGYRVELDKLAPELMGTGEQVVAGSSASTRSGASTVAPHGKSSTMSTAVPESVSKHFLKVDSDYFFPDRSPAFVDRGAKLATRGEHPEVVRALVGIAKERGWDSVTVKGSEAFRRAAWIEAARNGMQIAGYKPTELDLAQLKQHEPDNSIEPSPVRDQKATRPVPLAKSTEEKQTDRALEAKLSAFANDRPTLVVKKYPELVQAYALLDVARKFAEVHMPGHEDRFVAIGRELISQQIRDGKEVVGPRIHPDQIDQSQSSQQKSVAGATKGAQSKEIIRER